MVLSMLLSVCSEYGIEHDIKYNTTVVPKLCYDIFLLKVERYTHSKLFAKWWNIATG